VPSTAAHSRRCGLIYGRFIDDGFFVWERDRASLDAFLAALNSALPGIQLTWDTSTTSIAFMDLVIAKDLSMSGATVLLVVSTHLKAHNQYLYVPWGSFHRTHMFAAFVRGELIRYAVTNTHRSGFEHMKGLFLQRLLERGYPSAWLDPLFASVSHASRAQHLSQSGRSTRHAGTPTPAPVFVAASGPAEMRGSLSAAINAAYTRHAHHPQVQRAMGGAERVTVAFTNPPSLAARLVRAQL
jgi:hypothetical protein